MERHRFFFLLKLVLCCLVVLPAGCALQSVEEPPDEKPPPVDDWTTTLPISPGESLKKEAQDGRQKQVITLFALSDLRAIQGVYFISATGHAEVDGGGQFFAGMNRSLDPYIELTVTSPQDAAFQECLNNLDKNHLRNNTIVISGIGYYTSRPGIKNRRLGVFRLDTVSECKLVPRR